MKASDQYNLPESATEIQYYQHKPQSHTLDPVSQSQNQQIQQQFLSPSQNVYNDREQSRAHTGLGNQTMFNQNIENSPQRQDIGQRKNSNGNKTFQVYQNPMRLNSAGIFSNRAQTNKNKLRISKEVIYLSEHGDHQTIPSIKGGYIHKSEGYANRRLKYQLNQLEIAHKQQNTQNQLLNNDLERQFSLMLNWYLDKAKGNTNDTKSAHILISNLKRDYDKALKDIKEKDEIIDNLEKNKTITKIRELEEERTAYMNECLRLHKLLQKFKAKYGEHSPQRSQIENNLEALQQEASQSNAMAQEALAQYEGMVKELQSQLDKFNEENEELVDQNEKMKSQLIKMEEVLVKQGNEMDEILKQRELDQENLNQAYEDRDKLNELEEQAKQMSQEMQEQEKGFKEKLKKIQKEKEKLKDEIEALKKDKEQKDRQLVDLRKQISDGNDLGQKLDRKRQKNRNMKKKLEEIEDKLNERNEKITSLELHIDDLKYQQSSQNERDKELQEMKSKFVTEINELKLQLENKSQNYQQLEGTKEEVDRQVQEKEETISNLRKQIQAITIQSQDEERHSQMSESKKYEAGMNTQALQELEDQVEKLKDAHEQLLEEKEQRILDLELELKEAKNPINRSSKADEEIKEEYEQKLKKQKQEYEDMIEQLKHQVNQQQQTLDEQKVSQKIKEQQMKENEKNIENMKKEKKEISNAICDKIQRCIHIMKVSNVKEMLTYLQDGLAWEEQQEMTDVLAIQFGINKFEAKYLQETLNFDNNLEDLAIKLIEMFGKEFEIKREEIHAIGEKIQENIPISNFEQFLNQHNLPTNMMIHHIQIDTILKPFISNEERYKLIIYLLRQAKNFHKIDAQKLIKIVNPSQGLKSFRDMKEDDQVQSLQSQIPIEESKEILQLGGATRVSQITVTNPLDMSHQETIQLKIQQNDSFKILTQELAKQQSHFRRLIQIFHNSQIYPGREVEVILFNDLYQVMVKMNLNYLLQGEGKNQILLGLKELDAIHIDPSTKQQIIVLPKLIEGLKYCGYKDLEKPKSKKNFDFEGLDIKSIRVMNRLSLYVSRKELPIDYEQTVFNKLIMIFRPVLFQCLVKTLTKEETVFLIKKENFYKRLADLGIRKSEQEIPHLSIFLQIDSAYPHLFLFKKLARAIEEFSKNEHFRMIGMKRAKLEDQKRQLSVVPEVEEKQMKGEQGEEEYEYYEEDEEKELTTHQQPEYQTFNQQQVLNEVKQTTQDRLSSGTLPNFGGNKLTQSTQQQPQQVIKTPGQPGQEESEYEYYEEEAEEEKQDQSVPQVSQNQDLQPNFIQAQTFKPHTQEQEETPGEQKKEGEQGENEDYEYEYYEET